MLLALDTSGDVCSLALGDGKTVLAEYHFYHKMNLMQRVTDVFDKLLADCGKTVSDIEGVVVSLGPGSFTGLRIGLTMGKMLAFTENIPIVGVPTCEALALSALPRNCDYICALIHARKGEVYMQLFNGDGDNLSDCEVTNVADLGDKLPTGKIYFRGNGAVVNGEELRKMFPEALFAPEYDTFARGAALLARGSELIERGETADPARIAPLYVKKPTPVVKLEERLRNSQ